MLRREAETTQRTFADQARAMLAIPEDHVLLRMRRAIDWVAVETALGAYYDAEVGRPKLAAGRDAPDARGGAVRRPVRSRGA